MDAEQRAAELFDAENPIDVKKAGVNAVMMRSAAIRVVTRALTKPGDGWKVAGRVHITPQGYVHILSDVGQLHVAHEAGNGAVVYVAAHAPPQAEVPSTEMYYLQDSRSYVGNCPTWWGPERSGYVTRLDRAGKYTREEALRQHAHRSTDIPWLCSDIDAILRPTVDMQDLRRLTPMKPTHPQESGDGRG